MNAQIAAAAIVWSERTPQPRRHARARDLIGPLAAVVVLIVSHLAFGATQTVSALGASALMILTGLAALAIAGPRHIHPGVTLAALGLWAFALLGPAGPMDRAAPDLAVLGAAIAAWTVGYIAARQRRTLDIAWTALIWSSLLYAVLFFFGNAANDISAGSAGGIEQAFENPASASITFGLFVVLGLGRVLHMIKRMDAEAASGSDVFGRVLREGLGGMLLAGFSVPCLLIVATQQALILTLAVMTGYVAWDLRKVMSRADSGILRSFSWITPPLAVALAVWGLAIALLDSASDQQGLAAAGASHLTRMETYFVAFLERPLFGHGLGTVDAVGAANTTLFNANAMLADGGARNLPLEWLVETGVLGFAALLAVLVAIHLQILSGMTKQRIPRTFLRLAIATGALMLLHGVADSSLDLPSAVWFYALLTGAACGVASTGRLPAGDSRIG